MAHSNTEDNNSIVVVSIPPELSLLQQQLESLGLSSQHLHQAALQSIQSPMQGFDPRFGKSAIKTYRSYWKQQQQQRQQQQRHCDKDAKDIAQALRTAHQIQFLIQRHLAHATEWIRHDDRAENAKGHSTNNNNNTNINSNNTNTTLHYPKNNHHPTMILVLDNLRSAMNVGSLFRSAEATGCAAIYTCGRTPHPFGNGHDKVIKTSLGAEQLVPTRHFGTTQEALERLRVQMEEDGCVVRILGLETTEQSLDYVQLDYTTAATATGCSSTSTNNPGKQQQQQQQQQQSTRGCCWALVLGNEVTGVDPSLSPYMDHWIEIPMMGQKNSLNVAVCAPIVLYEILRQHRMIKPPRKEQQEEQEEHGVVDEELK